MKTRHAFVIFVALTLSACTSMKITGVVTDQKTGEPIGRAGIVSGPRSAWTDPIGRYRIGVDRSWKSMKVVADGYVPQDVPFETAPSRHPIYNIQMTPKPTRNVAAKPAPAEPVKSGAAGKSAATDKSAAAEKTATVVHPLPDSGASQ